MHSSGSVDGHPAKRVAEMLGIGWRDLETYRKDRLERVRDYWHERGACYYTSAGISRLREVIAESDRAADMASSSSSQGDHKADPLVADFVVERLCPNPTWVQCRRDGKLVDIRVYNNRVMRRGQPLRAVLDGDNRWRAMRVRG